jgi:hypothetical protein
MLLLLRLCSEENFSHSVARQRINQGPLLLSDLQLTGSECYSDQHLLQMLELLHVN